MLLIFPLLADNPIGADPLVGIYKTINARYPALGLTQANSKVLSILPAATFELPRLTRILIQKGTNPVDQYEFFYSRYDITTVFKNPYWTVAEVPVVQAYTTELQLLQKLAQKSTWNLREQDVWLDRGSMNRAGGTSGATWLFECRPDSPYFMGKTILRLHRN